MVLLISGLILFAGVHFVPSLAPGVKSTWRNKLGEGGYKGSFSLLLLASFALMIFGWRSTQPEFIYATPPGLRHAAMAVVCFAFFLLAISNRPSRVRRWIRHPQLTGVLLWALAHLTMNGDSRSLALFGAMALWSAVEMLAINKREGPREMPESPPLSTELISVLITAVVVAIVVTIHPYLSGMSVI